MNTLQTLNENTYGDLTRDDMHMYTNTPKRSWSRRRNADTDRVSAAIARRKAMYEPKTV